MSRKLTQRDLHRFYRLTDMMQSGPVGTGDGQMQGMRVTTNVPVFPEGEVSHPEYGDLDFSRKNLLEYVRNFDDRVRKIDICVDLDHKNEDAAGWVKRLTYSEGEGVYADVEWNRHGQALLSDKNYRYISPQFGDYTDEQTGETYQNVLIALTLTNFPFLKQMPAVSLDERQRRRPAKLVDRARRALLTDGYSRRDRRLFERLLHSKANLPEQRVPCKQGCVRCARMSLPRRATA